MIALLIRDLRLALRAGGGFGLGLAFFLLLAMLIPLGVGPEGGTLAKIAPGILWVGALLACLLSLDRIFALDFEDGSLDLLATAPIPLEGAVAVKALAHWLVTGLPLALAAPLLGVLLHLPGQGLVTAAGLAGPWHARAFQHRNLWGCAGGGGQTRRPAALAPRAAALCAHPDLRGRGGEKRGAAGMDVGVPLALLAAITLGRHGGAALRLGLSPSYQPAIRALPRRRKI